MFPLIGVNNTGMRREEREKGGGGGEERSSSSRQGVLGVHLEIFAAHCFCCFFAVCTVELLRDLSEGEGEGRKRWRNKTE